jgi:hypothetical protein
MIPETNGEINEPLPKMLDRIDPAGCITLACEKLPCVLVFFATAVVFSATRLACCWLA